MTLKELLVKYYLTDKGHNFNSHITLYEELFAPYKDTATKVFEIGINRGNSLEIWSEYFTKAHVYGADIRRSCVEREPFNTNITHHQLDQSSKNELITFAKEHGPFDIIIDDGSHQWAHQILTFETLWDYVNPSGLYVIEDLCTSYPEHYEGHRTPGITCIEYLKKLVDDVNLYGGDLPQIQESVPRNSNSVYDLTLLNRFQRTVKWLMFRYNIAVLKKTDDRGF